MLNKQADPSSGRVARRDGEAFAVDGLAIVDCVVAADELPNIPHIELGLAAHYAIAKVREAAIAVTGR